MIVQSFGIFSTHAFLNHERITGVSPPLFVKRSDATAAAIRDHVTNPLGIQRPCSTATFATQYYQIRQKIVFRQPQRPKRRLVGNEFDQAGMSWRSSIAGQSTSGFRRSHRATHSIAIAPI